MQVPMAPSVTSTGMARVMLTDVLHADPRRDRAMRCSGKGGLARPQRKPRDEAGSILSLAVARIGLIVWQARRNFAVRER